MGTFGLNLSLGDVNSMFSHHFNDGLMKFNACEFIQVCFLLIPLISVQAMTLIDSTASFAKRCSDIDESGALLEGLKNQGVRCFSALAFTIGTPQTAPSDRQYDELAAKIFGADPTLGQVSSLRRLHFEATTLIVASLNEQVKSDSADPGTLVKKLPAAEKQARLEKQQARLSGL